MLQRSPHAAAALQGFPLQTFNGRNRHLADQVSVLAEALLGAAPAGIAHHIQHRRIRNRAALTACLQRYGAADLTIQLHIPGAAERQGHREYGGPDRHVAMRAFLADQYRNAQPRMLQHIPLERIHRFRTFTRRQASSQRHTGPRVSAQHPVKRTNAAPGNLLLEAFCQGHLTVSMFIGLPAKRLNQLTGLLFQSHQSEQMLRPFFSR
ncbi:hypothetical protein D3C75_630970 [compost metagenome]